MTARTGPLASASSEMARLSRESGSVRLVAEWGEGRLALVAPDGHALARIAGADLPLISSAAEVCRGRFGFRVAGEKAEEGEP